jgi:O-antigen/teichoic acid export membrane protein
MIEKRQLFINAIMSVVQTVGTGVILFILYRYLLKVIGVQQLGIWSLVVATTSVSQIAGFGLSGSVVKFVAKYIARGEDEKVSGVIQTGMISIAVLTGVVLVAGYPIAKKFLYLVIPHEHLARAFSILPSAFIAFWLLMVNSTIQSSLDGYQRNDLKSSVMIVGSIIHLSLCFLLAPSYGLLGVAYARVTENFSVSFCSWLLLRKRLSSLPFIPYKWNRKLFKEIFSYGVNVQIMTGVTMLYDPVTKAFLSKFGNLSMVGYYEMASKMVWQFRGLIVSANQVLIPVIANLQERIPEKIKDVYLTSYKLLFYLSFPLYSFIIVCLPLISELWIGYYERDFVLYTIFLSAGWFLNTLSAPAYFANMGTGELRWNTISHFSIAFANAGLGYSLGVFTGGMGVVIAWVISLAIGSSLISIPYHKKHNIQLTILFPKDSIVIAIACLFGIIFTLGILTKLQFNSNIIISNIIIILMFLVIIIIPIWLHPMRKHLASWIHHELLNIGGIK